MQRCYCSYIDDVPKYYDFFGQNYHRPERCTYFENQNLEYRQYRDFLKIEIKWLNEKLKTKNYKIIDYKLMDNHKEVYIKLLDKNIKYKDSIQFLKMPDLIYTYENNHNSYMQYVYFWRKPNGQVVQKKSWHKITEHNNPKNILKVGYVNKYGWVLEFIDYIKFFDLNYSNDKSNKIPVAVYLNC